MLACAYLHSLYTPCAHRPLPRRLLPRICEWRERQLQRRRVALWEHDGRLPHRAWLGNGDHACGIGRRDFSRRRADEEIQRQRPRAGCAHPIASFPPRRRARRCAHGAARHAARLSHLHHARAHRRTHRGRARERRSRRPLFRAGERLRPAASAQPVARRRGRGAHLRRAQVRAARPRPPHPHARHAAFPQRRRGRFRARPQ